MKKKFGRIFSRCKKQNKKTEQNFFPKQISIFYFPERFWFFRTIFFFWIFSSFSGQIRDPQKHCCPLSISQEKFGKKEFRKMFSSHPQISQKKCWKIYFLKKFQKTNFLPFFLKNFSQGKIIIPSSLWLFMRILWLWASVFSLRFKQTNFWWLDDNKKK